MEDFRIVKSQYGEFSVERLNHHSPRKWVPCGDLRNPIPSIAGELGYAVLEANRKIYWSMEEVEAAIYNYRNCKRVWEPVL